MKRLTALFSIFSFFLLFPPDILASSLVNITPEGEIVMNVLGTEDMGIGDLSQSNEISVNKVASRDRTSNNSEIKIDKTGNEVVLTVADGEKVSTLNLGDGYEELVEIEAVKKPDTVRIFSDSSGFKIVQKGFTAVTSFPIQIDSKRRELSVLTNTGSRYLVIFPADAIDSILKTKIINRVNQSANLLLEESESGEITYLIEGKKLINIFNVYNYELPVKTRVSASTGEVMVIEDPSWLRMFNFLFV